MWLIVAFALLLLLGPLFVPDPNAQSLRDSLQGPSLDHLLGTDNLGRDAAARLLEGTRTTTLAALTAVGVAIVIGLPLGLLSGYVRGGVDAVLARVADAVMAVPPLILLLAAIAALGTGVTKAMVILGVILAPRLFRVARGATIGLGNSGFLEVARMSGCSTPRILWRYVLPNVRSQVVVQICLLFSFGVLTEAGISFLGLGVQPPSASLGVLLRTSIEYLRDAPLLVIAPGVVITALILVCNLIGDRYTRSKEAS
ncbi:ABC transporter permease [Rhodococcus sp. IEGM 1381]|uniref:ABC transporter permease n=1 Tax=Rhodococcus sp. IEGM 1381 TaxID=3047085 RepID=UPI0024B81D25|nr:ABC transporter permease [Rhodococcus sp. IEGM 1381]MDI9894434.1 ABC transporter permease [Rhodococcus sp. IEGM 1381]